MTRSLTFLIILAATFVVTAPAPALVTINQTSVAASGGTVTITGTSGQQGLRVAGCTNANGIASQRGPGICITDDSCNDPANGDGSCVVQTGGCDDTFIQGKAVVFCTDAAAARLTANLGNFADAITVTADVPSTLNGGDGDDTLQGGPAADILNGGNDDDTLHGGGGDDSVRGAPGNDLVEGGAGDDTMTNEPGADIFDGGAGARDTIDYSAIAGPVNVSQNASRDDGPGGEDLVRTTIERIVGTAGNDVLSGGTGAVDNILEGGAGADTLRGGPGDDVLNDGGGASNDSLDGGDGSDTVDLSARTEAVTASILAGHGGRSGESDTYIAMESLTGGAAADALTGNAGPNTLTGGAGNDTLTGLDGADALSGDAGADTLDAGAGADTVDGGADNDTVGAGAGPDAIVGDPGADTIDGGPDRDGISYLARTGPVTINLGAATNGLGAGEDQLTNVEDATGTLAADRIFGTDGPNVLIGDNGSDAPFETGGNDVLQGLGGNDVLQGNAGDDTLSGGAGLDQMSGGAGEDGFLPADGQKDSIDGGAGRDLISYDAATAPVTVDLVAQVGGVEGEQDQIVSVGGVVGGPFADVLRGSDFDDPFATAAGNLIAGGPGDDVISGRGGPDTLIGGPGKDELDGGAGSDRIDGGGEPNDIVNYSEKTNPIRVTLDGVANDGETGENDALIGIENVWGGSVDDVIIGADNTNVLYGNAGNDQISSLGGRDKVIGGPGTDAMNTGPGDDDVEALDSTADNITCGGPDDRLLVDPVDVLAADCPVPAPATTTPPTPPASTVIIPTALGAPAPVDANGLPIGGGVAANGKFTGTTIGTKNPGPPKVSGFRASPARFKRTTSFGFRSNEVGTALIVFKRQETGRRQGRRCVAQTRRNRSAKKCTRFVPAGQFAKPATTGVQRIAFNGARLRRARHRATLTVVDGTGNRSKPLQITITRIR